MRTVFSPTDRLIFYSLEERTKLMDLLIEGAKSQSDSPPDQGLNLSPQMTELSTNTLIKRRVMELDCEARDQLAQFNEWRSGKLNETIQLCRKLRMKSKGLVPRFEALISEFKPVLENYGPSLHEDAQKLLDRFRAAAQLYERRYGRSPNDIKSEGKHDSRYLASACLNEFLVAVCVTWHHATSQKVGAGSSQGPFGKFAEAAAAPFVTAVNRSAGRFLISSDWPSLANRIASRDIQKHNLLNLRVDDRSCEQN